MAWQELDLGAKELVVEGQRHYGWNAPCSLAMGDPAWVDIMWDASERYLGIRAVNAATGVPVDKEPKYRSSIPSTQPTSSPLQVSASTTPYPASQTSTSEPSQPAPSIHYSAQTPSTTSPCRVAAPSQV